MIERVQIGKTNYLDNCAKVNVKVINPINIHSRLERVSLAEASHAVIDPENTEYISGNKTKVRSINEVQAAAHHGDGDDHDRLVTEATGGNYDAAIPIADRILEQREDQVIALASFLMDNGGNATRGEIFNVIERVKKGPEFQIEIINPDGERLVQRERGVGGEIIIVNFSDKPSENQNVQVLFNKAA